MVVLCLQGDERTRLALHKLRQTWTGIFQRSTLYKIDLAVNAIDPAWPIVTPQPVNTPLTGHKPQPVGMTSHQLRAAGKVHVNPHFLQKNSVTSASTTATATATTATSTTVDNKLVHDLIIIQCLLLQQNDFVYCPYYSYIISKLLWKSVSLLKINIVTGVSYISVNAFFSHYPQRAFQICYIVYS